MELWYKLTPESGSDMVALDNAIYRVGCIGTTWKQIHATLSGTYLWRPRKKMGKHVFELDLVENLQVKREPGDCD